MSAASRREPDAENPITNINRHRTVLEIFEIVSERTAVISANLLTTCT